jgi:hypothetical protein
MILTDTLEITPEILNLIAELDEFKGAWQALGSRYAEEVVCCCRIRLVHEILITRHSIGDSSWLSSEIAHLAASRIEFRRNTLRTWEDAVLAKHRYLQ